MYSNWCPPPFSSVPAQGKSMVVLLALQHRVFPYITRFRGDPVSSDGHGYFVVVQFEADGDFSVPELAPHAFVPHVLAPQTDSTTPMPSLYS